MWVWSRNPNPHKRNDTRTASDHSRTNRPDKPTQPNPRKRRNGHANPATRHPRNRAKTRTGEPNETDPREDKSDNTHKGQPEQNSRPQKQNPQNHPRQNPSKPPRRTPTGERHNRQEEQTTEPARPPRTENTTQTRTKKNKRQQHRKHPQTKIYAVWHYLQCTHCFLGTVVSFKQGRKRSVYKPRLVRGIRHTPSVASLSAKKGLCSFFCVGLPTCSLA